MWKTYLCAAVLALSFSPAHGQTAAAPAAVELANLSEQVRGLAAQVGDLTVRLDQLEKENSALRAKLAAPAQNAPTATTAQLNAAVADLRALVQSTEHASNEATDKKIVMLADKTNAALDALAKGLAARPPVTPTFTDDYPKDAVLRYTVQKGDSLDLIVKKTGAKKQDIINANKLAAPYTIQLGQTLQIPGGKLSPSTP